MRDTTRISRVFYYEGVAFGLFLGTIVFAAIEALRFFKEAQIDWTSPVWVLFPALLAAWVTVKGFSEQTKTIQDLEIEKLVRAERARKAGLPNALSELSEELRKLIIWYLRPQKPSYVDWEASAKALREISDVIEFSDIESGAHLAAISAHFQVIRSRTQEAERRLKGRPDLIKTEYDVLSANWASTLVRIATLKVGVEEAFEYGRDEVASIGTPKITADSVAKAVVFSAIPDVAIGASDDRLSEFRRISEATFDPDGAKLKDLL